MMPALSETFHQLSKRHAIVPVDPQEWPEEWKTIYYKQYTRLPQINLFDERIDFSLSRAIQGRKSRRDLTRTPLTKQELSSLLKFSCGTTSKLTKDQYRRAQPSGGGRFPIEVYPVIFRNGEELPAGVYHYNVKNHTLEVLWNRLFTDEDIEHLFLHPWVKDAFGVMIMTAVFWRTQNKYQERGYRYILLEAGHIGQNMYLVSEALGIKCCALAGTFDKPVEQLIDLDGITESVVYALTIGK